jgi:hypothetical protein
VPRRAPRHHFVFGDDPEPKDVGPKDTVHRIRFVPSPIRASADARRDGGQH